NGLSNAATAAVLALGIGLLSWPLRGQPALRHRLWILVLLKLLMPPFWNVPLAWPSAPSVARPAAASVVELVEMELDAPTINAPEVDPRTPTLTPPARALGWLAHRPDLPTWPDWSRFVAGLWLAGSCVTLAIVVTRVRRFQRVVLSATRPASPDVRELVADLADRIGLSRLPSVCWVKGPVSPMIWGVFCRPRLILPIALWSRLDATQRETLLVHELAHLRRRDHWVRGLELVVSVLYWWFPVTWWARFALRDAEETCCDAWVVWTLPGAQRRYAETLVESLDFLSTRGAVSPSAASGIGRVSFLKRRIVMIMQKTPPRRLTWSSAFLSLGISALLLPLAPSWGQVADEPDETAQVVVETTDDKPIEARAAVDLLTTRKQVLLHNMSHQVEAKKAHAELVDRLKAALKALESGGSPEKEGQAAKDAAHKALLEAIRSLQAEQAVLEQKLLANQQHEVRLALVDSAKGLGVTFTNGAEADVKALEALVRQRELEMKKASAELQAARTRLAALRAKGGDAKGGDGGPYKTRGGVTVAVPHVTVEKTPLFTHTFVAPEQDRRMSKIEQELKRLSEELAKLREEPTKEKAK
ncbi:MAG: M56 family metallopeptidase, partial [Isosphaeraceae bacterium]|nr:M56 family metallopeptidase [Isosphaeraceae bacterium]